MLLPGSNSFESKWSDVSEDDDANDGNIGSNEDKNVPTVLP